MRDGTNPNLPSCMVRSVQHLTDEREEVTCLACSKVPAKLAAAQKRWDLKYGKKETRR